MKIPIHLYINQYQQMRMTKRPQNPLPTELGLTLEIEIPDAFFRRPNPKATIQIPEDYILNPHPQIVVKMLAPQLAAELKLEIKAVEDGLTKMLAATNNPEEIQEREIP